MVLLVLDTLRGDSFGGLEKLTESGFVKLDGVAPSSWTLPSHVSMFTGKLSSEHGVRTRAGIAWEELMRISRATMEGDTLLTHLAARGYTTYGHSANQFISPQFGFVFDHQVLFDGGGAIEGPRTAGPSVPLLGRLVAILTRKGVVGGAARWLFFGLVGRALLLGGREVREKGATPILRALKETTFKEPFFSFVNLMEAHQPYLWWPLDALTVKLSILGRRPHTSWWKKLYPEHARIATSSAAQVVSHFEKYDPLVIVTSDHGQLIGEGGRFGHGWSLDEALLKVPIFVRLPKGSGTLSLNGPVASLSEVRKLVEDVLSGRPCAVGAETAAAESWGFEVSNVREVAEREGVAKDLFATRVRVFSAKGSVLLNRDTGEVEEASPGLSPDEARELLKSAPAAAPILEVAPTTIPSQDEKEMLDRLRKLGYE